MMKRITTITMLGALLLVASCEQKPAPAFPIPKAEAAEVNLAAAPAVSPEVEAAVRRKGDAIVSQAFGVLSSRMGKALAESGHTNTIEFCSVHGIPLTTSLAVTNDVVLRRVTHRPRNPLNRADASELAIILQMQAEQSPDTVPKPVVTALKPGVISYYAPIVLNLPLCLTCHGEPGSEIKPEVLTEIRTLYPADEATGFTLGQVRGLWSVEFKRSDFITQTDTSPRPKETAPDLDRSNNEP